jgi:hypothetical protein
MSVRPDGGVEAGLQSGQRRLEPVCRGIQGKVVGTSRQGGEAEKAAPVQHPAVPVVVVQSLDAHVGLHHPHSVIGRPDERDRDLLPHRAVAAVGADEVGGTYGFAVSQANRYRGRGRLDILFDRHQFGTQLYPHPVTRQPRPQNLLGTPLRHEPQVRVGHVGARRLRLGHPALPHHRLPVVDPHQRCADAGGEDLVEDTELDGFGSHWQMSGGQFGERHVDDYEAIDALTDFVYRALNGQPG